MHCFDKTKMRCLNEAIKLNKYMNKSGFMANQYQKSFPAYSN